MTLRPLHRSGGKLARGTFVVCALAVVVLVVAVPSALAADQVKLTVKGTSFAGTEKNTGSTTHNFISIGTSGQESNPITSFTVNGQQCQLYAAYGSAYCSVNLPPGATATFSGTIQTSTTSFTFCTSDNSGINNDCNNVSAGTGPTPCPISQALLDLDVELGRTIHGASAGTLRGVALGGAIHRLEQEKLALIKGNVTGKVFGITGYSAVTQLAVIDYLFGGAQVGASSGNVQLAVEDLKKARTIKKTLEKLINDHGCA